MRLRRRDKIRNTPTREQSSQGVYDILVQESRQLMAMRKYDEAEAKARMAQRMNVVPPLTAERAETVLHEIAMAKAQKAPVADMTKPMPEAPSIKIEREANELLAKGQQEAAAAKFTEADRLTATESLAAVNVKTVAPVAPAAAQATPASDPAVQQIAATEPGAAPELAAPADNLPAPALNAPVAAGDQAAPAVNAPAPAVDAPVPAAEGAAVLTATPGTKPEAAAAPAAAKPANHGEVLLGEAQ